LISHAGEEKAVHGAGRQTYNNPLWLRRALDHGVREVVAHCASIGEDVDLDRGACGPKVAGFDLFARLMAEPRYRQWLFGDISAITRRNRAIGVIKAIVGREAGQGRRLANGIFHTRDFFLRSHS
jgi:uncharacterized protein